MDNVIRHPSTNTGDDDDRAGVPQDTEAEGLVVGAIMHDVRAYTEAAQLIDRTDIYREAHRLIWDVVTQLVEEGAGVHPVAVRARIGQMGQLRVVDNGLLIDRLGADFGITPGMVGHFAQIVSDRAHERRYDEHASELKAAIARKASGDELDKLVAEFQQRETLRANTGHGPAHLVSSILDWETFFGTDFGNVVLLPGRLMAPGQQITIVGDGKAGKSLFTQEWLWRMATGRSFLDDKPGEPVTILYLDSENGQEQVQERFYSFGAGPGRMGQLRYASFPPVRPLDTAGGGADLMAMVKATGAQLIVLDTVSRFISGPENDADTWLSLYRHTLLPLKRDRIASVRLDHLGKDGDRGARGSSAKNQDVDHVWTLAAQGGGILSLRRTHTRTGIGPDEFIVRREARRDGDNWVPGATRHVICAPEPSGWENGDEPTGMAAIPGTVEHIMAALDRAGVPHSAGNRQAREALASAGVQVRNDRIAEAVRRRKATPDMPGFDTSLERSPERSRDLDGERVPGTFPKITGNTQNPSSDVSGNNGEQRGTAPVPHPSPSRREGVGEHREHEGLEPPLCLLCHEPVDQARAAAGYDTHHPCPTT